MSTANRLCSHPRPPTHRLTPERKCLADISSFIYTFGRVNLEVGSSEGVEATGTDVFQSDQHFRVLISTHNRQGKASQRHTAPLRPPGTKPHRHSVSVEACPHLLRAGHRDLL